MHGRNGQAYCCALRVDTAQEARLAAEIDVSHPLATVAVQVEPQKESPELVD